MCTLSMSRCLIALLKPLVPSFLCPPCCLICLKWKNLEGVEMEVLANPWICSVLKRFVFLQYNIWLWNTFFEEACNSSILLAGGQENRRHMPFRKLAFVLWSMSWLKHLAQWSYSIAFFEMSFIPLVRLRSFCKTIKADRFRKEMKDLIYQVCQACVVWITAVFEPFHIC